jgi:hypothetical protein
MSEDDPLTRYVLMVLYQSQQDQASEVTIGPYRTGEPPVRYKVEGTWHDWSSPDASLASKLIGEVERLAAFPEGPFPREGTIDLAFAETRLRWRAQRPSADSACVLTPLRP